MSANRKLMERYWAAAEANDLDAMHHLRAEALVVDFPQTGERLSGRDVVRVFEEGHDAGGSFELTGLTGDGDVWVAEGVMRSAGGVFARSLNQRAPRWPPRAFDRLFREPTIVHGLRRARGRPGPLIIRDQWPNVVDEHQRK